MKKSHRFMPEWPLPAYIFVPGANPHPKKEGGHSEGQGDPQGDPVDLNHPEKNKLLRYAVDLFNNAYFWESHVYFEALWNAHNRTGPVADFFKGFIKLGAAGVKLTISQDVSAREHFERAKELFLDVKKIEGENFLGFYLPEIISQIDLAFAGELKSFEIYPEWE